MKIGKIPKVLVTLAAFMLILVAPAFGNNVCDGGVNLPVATWNGDIGNTTVPAITGDNTTTFNTVMKMNYGAIPLGGVGMPAFDTNSITTETSNHGVGNVANKATVTGYTFFADNNAGKFAGGNNTTRLGTNMTNTGTGTGASSYGHNSVVAKAFNGVQGKKGPGSLVTFRLGGFNSRF